MKGLGEGEEGTVGGKDPNDTPKKQWTTTDMPKVHIWEKICSAKSNKLYNKFFD